jgi:hypothetical protein
MFPIVLVVVLPLALLAMVLGAERLEAGLSAGLDGPVVATPSAPAGQSPVRPPAATAQ